MGSRGMRFGFMLLPLCNPYTRAQNWPPGSPDPALVYRPAPKQPSPSVKQDKPTGSREQAGPEHWSDIH
jgi:hypothetical protein